MRLQTTASVAGGVAFEDAGCGRVSGFARRHRVERRRGRLSHQRRAGDRRDDGFLHCRSSTIRMRFRPHRRDQCDFRCLRNGCGAVVRAGTGRHADRQAAGRGRCSAYCLQAVKPVCDAIGHPDRRRALHRQSGTHLRPGGTGSGASVAGQTQRPRAAPAMC